MERIGPILVGERGITRARTYNKNVRKHRADYGQKLDRGGCIIKIIAQDKITKKELMNYPKRIFVEQYFLVNLDGYAEVRRRMSVYAALRRVPMHSFEWTS